MSTNSIKFFYGWHRAFKKPVSPLTRKEAEKRHNSKEQYTVVIYRNKTPINFIEVANGYFGVSFLDDDLNEYLVYAFEEINEMLFLCEATYREYNENTQKISNATNYYFDKNGICEIFKTEYPEKARTTAKTNYCVNDNWEKMPRFGEFGKILRKERKLG